MKKLGLLAIGLVSLGIACEFHAGTEEPAKAPPPAPPPPATAAPKPGLAARPAPIPTLRPKGPATSRGLPSRLAGRLGGGTPAPASTPAPGLTAVPSSSAAPPAPAPSGTDAPVAPVIHGQNALGNDQNLPGSWHGVVYFIPSTTTKLPDFSTIKPTASFYTKEINVAPRGFNDGFPGVDARTEWFGIEYYNTVNVTKEDDYYFRVVSDDGAKFYIDDTAIIDNDGIHPPQEAKGAAHLVVGVHTVRLDYFQGPKDQMAVQLFVTPTGGAEKTLQAALP